MSRSEISEMSLCLVLPHIITTCDGKADGFFTLCKDFHMDLFQVYHYMLLTHMHSDIIICHASQVILDAKVSQLVQAMSAGVAIFNENCTACQKNVHNISTGFNLIGKYHNNEDSK